VAANSNRGHSNGGGEREAFDCAGCDRVEAAVEHDVECSRAEASGRRQATTESCDSAATASRDVSFSFEILFNLN